MEILDANNKKVSLTVKEFADFFDDFKTLKIENNRVYLSFQEFIDHFAGEKVNIGLIEKIKTHFKGITIIPGEENVNIQNELLNKDQVNLFENALNNVRAYGVSCKFKEYPTYKRGKKNFSVDALIESSKKVNTWVEKIENVRVGGEKLSPFEKILYTLDTVTEHEYKLEEKWQSSDISRNIISVLDENNDKIVCAGYEAMLRHILNRLGINSSPLYLPSVIEGKPGHVTNLVFVDDPKYNIYGTFIIETTIASKRKEKGKDFRGAFLSISQAKEVFKDHNLHLSAKNLYESKIKLYASVNSKEELQYQKHMLSRQKQRFLDNFNGFVTNDKKFYKKARKEIISFVGNLNLTKIDKVAGYKIIKKKKINKNIEEALVNNFKTKLDDLYEYERFGDRKSIFDDYDEQLIKALVLKKYNSNEIADAFIKGVKKLESMADGEKVDENLEKRLSAIENISSEEADMIAIKRNAILNSEEEEDFFTTRIYIPKIKKALENIGLAKRMNKLQAKCFVYARISGWNDKQMAFAYKKFKDFNQQKLSNDALKAVLHEIDVYKE